MCGTNVNSLDDVVCCVNEFVKYNYHNYDIE